MTPANPHLTVLGPGSRLILDGRYGVVEGVTATHARVRFADEIVNLDRRREDGDLEHVEWPLLLGPGASGVLMDAATRTKWESWKPHNQDRTAARLAIVNLIATGCRSGYEGILNEEGEPIEELRSGGRTMRELKGEIHSRTAFLHRWLSTATVEWALQLRALWWATGSKDAPPVHDVPSQRTMERVFPKAFDGIYALADQRGGDQYESNEVGQRRATTERLVSLVLNDRTDASSTKTDGWYVRQVTKRAEQEKEAILAERKVRELVSLKLNQLGRTPNQRRGAQEAADRTQFQSNRTWVPGMVLAYDQTLGDNLVRMIPGGKAVRPNVHVVADPASGVIIAADATGLYRDTNVAMVLYDAARPMVVLPDEHGRWIPRIKGMTQEIVLGQGAFKPGGIASTYRSDNISQNHTRYMLGIMNLLGADISPSLPGRKTDNRHAETTIRGFAQFFEDADAYVGTHAANRGRTVGQDGSFDIDEYRALLQQFAYYEYNHRPTPVPMYKGTGMSRLQLWDHLIAEYGAPPALVDPNAYFSFLKVHTRTASAKGIQHDNEMYNSELLRDLPRDVKGPDAVVTYLADDRQNDCIWVPLPRDDAFIEVPNVLRDLTDAPLTRETAKKARELSGVVPTSGFHAATAYAHALEQIRLLEDPSVKIQRSLADMRAAWGTYSEVKSNGAMVLADDSQAHATDSSGDPASTSGMPRPEPEKHDADPTHHTPFAHPGPSRTLEDDLDQPIRRPE